MFLCIELELKLNNQTHVDVLNAIKNVRLPIIKKIKIDNAQNNWKELGCLININN